MRFAAMVIVLALVGIEARGQELAPGLVGVYYEGVATLGEIKGKKPVLVRVDKQVSFESVEGDFHGARVSGPFSVRWLGMIKIEKAGEYQFFTESDDGSRLYINDRLVVRNDGDHPMVERGGRPVTLEAGMHAIRLEYYQGGGGAGCQLRWQPAGKNKQAVPAAVLFHKKGDAEIAWDKAAWEKRPKAAMQAAAKGKFTKTDYGSYYTATIKAGRGNTTPKGIAIKVGTKEKPANLVFDTEMMRWSVGWTDGWLNLPNGRDGLEGQPAVDGAEVFSTRAGTPGWGKGAELADPRPGNARFGPLPREWAKYKGLYTNGDKVVVSYTVGEAGVLETPGFDGRSGALTRTLAVGPANAGQTMLVFEAEGKAEVDAANTAIVEKEGVVTAARVKDAPAGAKWEVTGGKVYLKLPATAQRSLFQVWMWKGPRGELSKFANAVAAASTPVDPQALINGGPARWTKTVETKGVPGTGKGAYVMDTLTVPYENPYDSYMRLTGMDFFSDGRAAVATIDGDVWIVSGIDQGLSKLTWKRYATGMFQSLGLKIVDGVIYVLNRDQITRLHDLNKDGEADFYENFNNDCHVQVAYHEFAHDLHTDRAGNFYFMKGSDLGGNGTIHAATMLRVSKDGSKMEVVATGFRAPNGMGVGPNDELTAGDNQGDWTPLCPINWVRPGKFYGMVHRLYPNSSAESERDLPICWLPMNVDNSAGGQVWVTSDKWGPLAGKLLHMSYGKCTIMSVMTQDVTVGGEPMKQGGVFKLPFKFVSGGMRARFNPVDGQLYVSGMKGWQTDANMDGCLHRVRYTGEAANMPVELKVFKGGVRITFTDPVDAESAGDKDGYAVEWFNVKRTKGYGSPEFKVSDENAQGREPVEISAANVSPDGKAVTLEMPGLRPVTNMVIKYKIAAKDGAAMNGEINNTIHVVPD